MLTAERTFLELCEEVDDLREAVAYWKAKYEEERDENIRMVNERLKDSQNGIATALAIALCVSDNPDGSLSIKKEDRQLISETINRS